MNFLKTAVSLLLSAAVAVNPIEATKSNSEADNLFAINIAINSSATWVKKMLADATGVPAISPSSIAVATSSDVVSIGKYNTKIDVQSVREYLELEDIVDWDDIGKINMVNTIYNYLVNEKELPKEFVAGILGNIMCEGNFGFIQGQYSGTKSMQQILNALDSSGGIGIIQWTHPALKKNLKGYYLDVIKKLGKEKLNVKCAIAELVCLYDILTRDGLLDKYNNLKGKGETLAHSACGLFACEFERYYGYLNQWAKQDGYYKCINATSNGGKRLKYTLAIYKHFKKKVKTDWISG